MTKEAGDDMADGRSAPLSPVAEWLKSHVCVPADGVPDGYSHEKFKEELDEFNKRNRRERPRRQKCGG